MDTERHRSLYALLSGMGDPALNSELLEGTNTVSNCSHFARSEMRRATLLAVSSTAANPDRGTRSVGLLLEHVRNSLNGQLLQNNFIFAKKLLSP